MSKINVDAVRSWFKGKGLVNVNEALGLLLKSEAQGQWLKGASRKVKSQARWTNTKIKNAGPDTSDGKAARPVYYAMHYGLVERLSDVESRDAILELSEDALRFFIDFQPVAAAISKLDRTRPGPVFTKMNASPLVTATLEKLEATSADVPPMKHEMVELTVNGKTEIVSVTTILWPEGTQFGTSPYFMPHCEACGHLIKSRLYVPMLLTDKAGGYKGLWVGRDCAQTLFGVKFEGELNIKK